MDEFIRVWQSIPSDDDYLNSLYPLPRVCIIGGIDEFVKGIPKHMRCLVEFQTNFRLGGGPNTWILIESPFFREYTCMEWLNEGVGYIIKLGFLAPNSQRFLFQLKQLKLPDRITNEFILMLQRGEFTAVEYMYDHLYKESAALKQFRQESWFVTLEDALVYLKQIEKFTLLFTRVILFGPFDQFSGNLLYVPLTRAPKWPLEIVELITELALSDAILIFPKLRQDGSDDVEYFSKYMMNGQTSFIVRLEEEEEEQEEEEQEDPRVVYLEWLTNKTGIPKRLAMLKSAKQHLNQPVRSEWGKYSLDIVKAAIKDTLLMSAPVLPQKLYRWNRRREINDDNNDVWTLSCLNHVGLIRFDPTEQGTLVMMKDIEKIRELVEHRLQNDLLLESLHEDVVSIHQDIENLLLRVQKMYYDAYRFARSKQIPPFNLGTVEYWITLRKRVETEIAQNDGSIYSLLRKELHPTALARDYAQQFILADIEKWN